MQPFNPVYGSGQKLTAAAASASVTISKGTKQFRVCNTGANPAYLRIGSGEQTATSADLYIEAGAIETFTKFQDAETLAYISAAGTTLNVILGEGA